MVFCCFLLTLKRKIATYRGYTVDLSASTMERRQPTKELRPWDMVCVVHGFATRTTCSAVRQHLRHVFKCSNLTLLCSRVALRHPLSDERTKERLSELVGEPGYGSPFSVRRRLVEIYEMLRLHPWHNMALTVSFTSEEYHGWGRELGEFYQWSQNTTCDTRSLCVWKSKAKKENRAKRLRKTIAKAALLVEARHRLRRLAAARYHRIRLAELEVEVLELRATNLTLRSKRSRDDVAPDSTSRC